MHSSSIITKFWQEHLALFYGIAFLLGIYAFLTSVSIIYIPAFFLWLPFILQILKGQRQLVTAFFLSVFLSFTAYFYCQQHYQFPDLKQHDVLGLAYLKIQSLSQQKTYFGYRWNYRCLLENFRDETGRVIAKHCDCSVTLSQKEGLQRPPADQDYLVSGILQQNEQGQYFLKISPKQSWKPIEGSWNLAEKRYKAKQAIKQFITSSLSYPKSAIFLGGLATGEFEDRLMQQDFSRFGLQHIMAISGFHFAIIASLLNFILRFLVNRQLSALLVILFLGIYFLFLGFSPSILRSWIMISIALGGYLIEKSSRALNSLGVALICVLIVDPLLCQTLGFQFSFLVTAAILILYTPCEQAIDFILPKRPLSQISEMDRKNQHAYYFLSLFRQGLALTLAVNLFAVPLTLYYFHQFPMMSLLYNLFFPLFVSFSMFLLIMGLLLGWLFPPLGYLIHSINSFYTKNILSLTSNIPSSMDWYYEIQNFPTLYLVLYLSLISYSSIRIRHWKAKKNEIGQDFVII